MIRLDIINYKPYYKISARNNKFEGVDVTVFVLC